MAERRRRVALEKQKGATINREEEEDEGEEEEEERGKMMMVMRGEEKSKSSVVVVVPPVKRVADGGAHQTSPPACQAEKCAADLLEAKRYHRRHKVCEHHAKALEVVVAGLRQRFCQQCSRFHELSEFDEAKRSCRRRLAGHNERRRKSSSLESHGEGSNRKGVGSQLKENPCKQADQSGRTQITFPGSTSFKHFQIR